MWFLSALFNFTTVDDKEATAMEWLIPALSRISRKTPYIVVESHDSIINDLDYNSVIRQEYTHLVGTAMLAES